MGFENIAAPATLKKLLQEFVTEFPEVNEIWLFGSRAEGLSDARDWDLLVFSEDRLTPEVVALATRFESDEFELFIARGDDFRRPWPRKRNGSIQQGHFSSWKFKFDWDKGQGTYSASADKPNRRGGVKPVIRIWRREACNRARSC